MASRTKKIFDVIVIGGGLAGLTLTALLLENNMHVLCIDREEPIDQLDEEFDGRTTAISYGSQKILESAGVWEDLLPCLCPIQDIKILDGHSPVLLQFSSTEVGDRIFGWIGENRLIRKILFQHIKKNKTAQHIAPATVKDFTARKEAIDVHILGGTTYKAPLIIGADGRFSFTRQWMGIGTRGWMYNQRAIVCTVTHENPHSNIAIEHFRKEGPFAILPMKDDEKGQHRSSVVWTEHGKEKNSAIHYNQDVFNAALTARFPDEYGCVQQIESRFTYPLGLLHAHTYIGHRMALIADAAHAIHPIAGQGLNLGFRDIDELVSLILKAKNLGNDIGSQELLLQYQRLRRFDNMAMAGATDGLNRLFSNAIPPISLGRKLGLKAVAKMPFAKKFFMNQAMGAPSSHAELKRKESSK